MTPAEADVEGHFLRHIEARIPKGNDHHPLTEFLEKPVSELVVGRVVDPDDLLREVAMNELPIVLLHARTGGMNRAVENASQLKALFRSATTMSHQLHHRGVF